jgi:septal ring factor EnvC (AmiA/AmiB activator)
MEHSAKKKKKTLIITISTLGILLLLVGTFFLGRISVKNEPKESKPQENKLPNDQEIQKLKTELNLVKTQLNQSNINQKKQLESKLSDIENKIKILTSQDKKIIQELEKEIREIKEKLRNDKPGLPPPDENRLKFTVYYFDIVESQKHM